MCFFIQNHNQQKIAVSVLGQENIGNKKLAFVQHGLSGHKGQAMVKKPAQAFVDNGYVVVVFDSRYSFGDSSGSLEKASLTSFIEDLQDVISWAKTQNFYAEPFALSGHSLGGGSAIKYAEDNPQKVSLLVPVSAMLGGRYYIRSRLLYDAKNYKEWKKEGRFFRQKRGDSSKSGYVSFDLVRDMIKYNLVKDAYKIACPSLVITGDKDTSSTIYNNKKLIEVLKNNKYLVILPDCEHLFETDENKQDLYKVINDWLKKHV